MNCPECGDKVRCLDTRTYDEPSKGFEYVERIRECTSCGHRFVTIEVSVDVWVEQTNDNT